MTEFDELRLRLRRIGPGRFLGVANGAAAGAAVLRINDEPARLRADYNRLVDIELRRAARSGVDVAAELRRLGREVHSLLFDGPLGEVLQAARESQGDRGLRLRFDLPADLADLPVEILCAPSDQPGMTLAFDAKLSLARTVRGGPAPLRLPAADDDRKVIATLVAVASPHDRPPIDAEAETEALIERVPDLAANVTVLRHATRAGIGAWLKSQSGPAAVLLIAHGEHDADGNGTVVLETEAGAADPVPGDLLSGLMVNADQLRLVVLNLCHSALGSRTEPFSGPARALVARGIPAVVGMSGLVSDTAARAVGPQVVEGVCVNKSVDEAVIEARSLVAFQGPTSIEWGTPTLFMHEACGHGWLFKAREVERGDDGTADFLQRGRDAEARMARRSGNVQSADLLDAARHRRYLRDWKGVVSAARVPDPGAALVALRDEAHLELAWSEVERLCADLAEDRLPEVPPVLDRLPKPLSDLLEAALEQLTALDDLMAQARGAEHDDDPSLAVDLYERLLSMRGSGFRDAVERLDAVKTAVKTASEYGAAAEHERSQRWEASADGYRGLLERHPDGYRDARQRLQYVQGRLHEAAGAWSSAVESYRRSEACGDAAARLAFAEGRDASEAGAWERAAAAFARTEGSVPDIGSWQRYAAARTAESAEDWEAMAAHLAGLDGFLDSRERRLLAAGQRALGSEDWLTAAICFAQVPGLDPPLEATYAGLFAAAAAAESAESWHEAATAYAALPEDRDGAAARRCYCAARAAELSGDWKGALAGYRSTPYRDARERGRYAEGRAAELERQWQRASVCYAALPPRSFDVEERLQYIAGRAAETRRDWLGVISGFADLPDAFAGGEVGRRRRCARAAAAVEADDWVFALALLGDDDSACDGLAGRLRLQANGARAEAAGDWATAAAEYKKLVAHDAEHKTRWQYAEMRRRIEAGDWGEALEHCDVLPEGHRDVAAHRSYATAKIALLQQDWELVVRSCQGLPAMFTDIGAMIGYARLRLAEREGDWDHVARLAAEYEGPESISAPAAYARAWLAERRNDWRAARAGYRACGGYADSTMRAVYAEAREAEETGRWSEALDAYRAAAAVAEATPRAERLLRLRTTLAWAESLVRTGSVADPIAEADPGFPYTALRAAEVTPSSDMDAVARAPFKLMRAGGIAHETRTALDRLRGKPERLLVDVHLHWVRDRRALARALCEIDFDAPTAPHDQMRAAQPGMAPLFLLLEGDRSAAIDAWRQRLAAAPGDLDAAHGLAVAAHWRAVDLESNGAWEQAEDAWSTALACWATLIANDGFWTGWRKDRAAVYGRPVEPADTTRLSVDLGSQAADLVAGHEQRHAQAGRSGPATRRRQLVYRFAAEQRAARSLREAGGLRLDGTRTERFACGPAYLRLAGLGAVLGEFVVALESDPARPKHLTDGALRRMRWSFSELGEAFAEFEQQRYAAALRALPQSYRLPRRSQPEDCAGPAAEGHAPADCAHCRDFLFRNPAYAHLPRRRQRLHRDAVELAIRAHRSTAYELLATDGRADEAVEELRAAIAVAANAAVSVQTRESARSLVFGRAKSLADTSRSEPGRLDQAVRLLETAAPLFTGADSRALDAELSGLLVDRALRRRADRPGADDAPVREDLRRALDLHPEASRPIMNYARLLVAAAVRRPDDRYEGLALMLEALGRMEPGLQFAGPTPALVRVQEEVLDQVQDLNFGLLTFTGIAEIVDSYGNETADELAARAAQRRADRNRSGAIDDLVRAVRMEPGSERLRAELRAAITEALEHQEGQQ